MIYTIRGALYAVESVYLAFLAAFAVLLQRVANIMGERLATGLAALFTRSGLFDGSQDRQTKWRCIGSLDVAHHRSSECRR